MPTTTTAKAAAAAVKATAAKVPSKAKAPAKTTAAKATAVKILDAKFTFGAPGTVRRTSWDALAKQKGVKTVEAYKAAGGATKYLARWAKAGAISIAA